MTEQRERAVVVRPRHRRIERDRPVGRVQSFLVMPRAFETGRYPYRTKLGRRAYEEEKAQLQAELLKVQLWAQETGQKFVLLFEGRDAAGKGGNIKRVTEKLDPRGYTVQPIAAPASSSTPRRLSR